MPGYWAVAAGSTVPLALLMVLRSAQKELETPMRSLSCAVGAAVADWEQTVESHKLGLHMRLGSYEAQENRVFRLLEAV